MNKQIIKIPKGCIGVEFTYPENMEKAFNKLVKINLVTKDTEGFYERFKKVKILEF